MATVFMEPGGDIEFAVTNARFWSAISGLPAVATDFVHGTHIKSIKYRPGFADIVTRDSIFSASGGRFTFYLYLAALPSGGGLARAPIAILRSSTPGDLVRIFVTSGGVLRLYDNGTVQLGANGATLSTGTWYRISLAYTVTSTTVNQLRLYKDGVQTITASNVTLPAATVGGFAIGNSSTDGVLDFRTSDHFADDSSSLTDTGNIWVTAKRPFANGSLNEFTTQVGSGGSGYGSGHSPQVNERARSDFNGWSIATGGVIKTEEYAIEGRQAGDINISISQIVDIMGWVQAKSLSSETASIIIDSATFSISLTSTFTLFIKFTGVKSYPGPGGTADIGIVTNTTNTTVTLTECGIVVAYIPGTASTSDRLMTNQAPKRAAFY